MASFVLKNMSKLDPHHQELGSVSFGASNDIACGHLIAMKSNMASTEDQILREKIRTCNCMHPMRTTI